MVELYGKSWNKNDFFSYFGDVGQVGGVKPFAYTDGKARGVPGFDVKTGSGFDFTVLPGRGMDIPFSSYKGVPISYASHTGVTAPPYFEPTGFGWLRSFFVGLLTTCGLRNVGPPEESEGESFGIHGRISNTPAENVSLEQEWVGDQFVMRMKGTMREAAFFGEHLLLHRTIETSLGSKKFLLTDVVENRGFDPEPLILLYHINFGFPLLGPNARIVGPFGKTEPRDEEAEKDRGVETCFEFIEPQPNYNEKVFFHTMKTGPEGNTFAALINKDVGDGTPLGFVLRYDPNKLPVLTEWKMMKQGTYVLGLEPGTVPPMGRTYAKENGPVRMIGAQEREEVSIEFEALDSLNDIEALEYKASSL